MELLQKRWIRMTGLIPMTLYSALSVLGVYAVLSNTIFRPPNRVFSGTDLVGLLGFLFFLGIIGGSGLLAIATAYFMRGVYKLLYVSGALALLSAALFFPFALIFNAEVDFYPTVEDPQVLIGSWVDSRHQLELELDGTYALKCDGGTIFEADSSWYSGTWRLVGNELHLSDLDPDMATPWEVRASDGLLLITYDIPDNPDAWSGNLGLMREADWRDKK